jgi:hypothetical protein
MSFADRFDSLGITSLSKYYSFTINLPNKQLAQTVAIPQENGLRSYTGGIFFNNNMYYSVVCKSDRATKDSPQPIKFVNNELQCPNGFQKLK